MPKMHIFKWLTIGSSDTFSRVIDSWLLSKSLKTEKKLPYGIRLYQRIILVLKVYGENFMLQSVTRSDWRPGQGSPEELTKNKIYNFNDLKNKTKKQ